MKRTPLTRKTPLKSGSSLSRKARAPIARKPMKRTRPTVTAEERYTRSAIAARSSGTCEGCGRARAVDAAHRKARSQGGPWCPTNLLHLCREDHRWQHDNPEAAREYGWTVPSHGDPASTLVWLARHGWVYLDADGGVTPTTRKDAA